MSQFKMAKAFLTQPLNIDRRKRQSEAKLFQALIRDEQTQTAFGQITVQQLCHEAHVSRATFYRHHDSISDVIMVECFAVVYELQQSIDEHHQIDFAIGSQLLIDVLYQHLDLFRLVTWSHTVTQVEALFSGIVQQVLRLQDEQLPMQRFISRFLGTAILNFSVQVATGSETLPKSEALSLFRLLMPKSLKKPDPI